MNYTHQQYLEDVRKLVVSHAKLTKFQEIYLSMVPIKYLLIPNEAVQFELMMQGIDIEGLRANTVQEGKDKTNMHIEIYASGEPCSPLRLACELIHEMGHVLAIISDKDDGHGPKWAECATSLGIVAKAYDGGDLAVSPYGSEAWDNWSNAELKARVEALPAITDWVDIDTAMKALGWSRRLHDVSEA